MDPAAKQKNDRYLPGSAPTSSAEVVWWAQQEYLRIGQVITLLDDRITEVAAGGAAWDFDEGSASAVYGAGTLDLEEGAA